MSAVDSKDPGYSEVLYDVLVVAVGLMEGCPVTAISIHQGGTPTRLNQHIDPLLLLCRRRQEKSTRQAKSKIFLSCTSAIHKHSTSTPRHTTTASVWNALVLMLGMSESSHDRY